MISFFKKFVENSLRWRIKPKFKAKLYNNNLLFLLCQEKKIELIREIERA